MSEKINETIELDGEVVSTLPTGEYEVKLVVGKKIPCYVAGKMKQFQIRVNIGDKVKVEISKYDITKGKINYRYPKAPRV